FVLRDAIGRYWQCGILQLDFNIPGILCSFFFNDPATTEIYTLSLHDALPISAATRSSAPAPRRRGTACRMRRPARDRKSTRLNSSHDQISYAVFCLKKKK